MVSWFDRSEATLLVLSQVYVPDSAAVGQHMHDAAVEMARRGYRVVVIASDRGYEDPSRRYPRYERLDGVHVLRTPWSSFGKSSIKMRLVGGGMFVSEAVLIAASLARVDAILVSTSPPMCGLAGMALGRIHRAPVTFWAMDINPDQIVALGTLSSGAMPVRAFDWMNRRILREASSVVALDRFMAERLEAKWPIADKLSIVPPWPPIDAPAEPMPHADNPFRAQHGLSGKFVVMYSGNLSPVHPVTTILNAARALRDDPRYEFVFIGGGLGRAEIDQYVRSHGLSNVRTLPYQPQSLLAQSLSAADVHLVSMGNDMVGIVHPSKIYGAMAVGRPVLVLGPKRSHLGELVDAHGMGLQVEHGDIAAAERALRELAGLPADQLAAMGRRGRLAVDTHYARATVCRRFGDVLEAALDSRRKLCDE
jgi:glycosyltransferase involved in cell wall biosynthesis